MMTGTLITEDNAELFMGAVGTNALVNSDVFIGVVDEETDTACGVLSAEAVGDRTLAVRWIYVDESRRRKGAGRELINTLQDMAWEIGAGAIVCSRNKPLGKDDVTEFFLSCGFVQDEFSPTPVYSYKVSDISLRDIKKKTAEVVPLDEVSIKDWAEMENAWKGLDAYDERLLDIIQNREFYDKNLSFAAMDSKGKFSGILVTSTDGQNIYLEDVFAGGDDPGLTAYAMFKSLVLRALKAVKDPVISVSYENKEMLFLLDKLTGGKGVQTEENILLSYFMDV